MTTDTRYLTPTLFTAAVSPLNVGAVVGSAPFTDLLTKRCVLSAT